MNKAPKFWNDQTILFSALSTALLPLSWIWRGVTAARLAWIKPEKAQLPVICIGNISVGGTGKTPFTAYLCQLLGSYGYSVCILTRGYGGKQKGPLIADPNAHSAADIGDEALMLSQNNLVCISRDRVAGARFIAANLPSDIIIMDDGMQNPWLKKDITLAVFDGAVGLGNGRILPAGPLRQSLKSALPSMDMAVINGGDKTGLKQRLPQKLTCVSPRLLPNPETADEIKQRSLLAFAGIGRPQGFFDTLEACGAVLVKTLPFADHHPYSEADLTRLYLEATQLGAELITTQKDWVRLPPEWRERIFVLDVSLMLDDDDAEQLMQTLAPYLHKEKG